MKNIISVHGVLVNGSDCSLSRKIYTKLKRQDYEHAEVSCVKAHLRSDDGYLELGGGLGVCAITAAKICRKSPIVVEANHHLCASIERNALLNHASLRLIRAAVGVTSARKRRFWLNTDCRASSFWNTRGASVSCDVRVVTLSSLLRKHCPSFLMCDIEGSELEVLGSSQLEGVATLCVEIHPNRLGGTGCCVLRQHLENIGFVQKAVDGDNNVWLFQRGRTRNR